MNFTKKEFEQFTLLEWEEGLLSPSSLRDINIPQVDLSKGVVLSGRAPIWFYGALISKLRPALWVATYDPRLGAAVVVSTHSTEVRLGSEITVS